MLNIQEPKDTWGGPWTGLKLAILEKYLDAFTTALKGKGFKLIYIDAFAGTGVISHRTQPGEEDAREFIEGSAVEFYK